MEKLTIKLLHERRSSNSRRKVDGKSGTLYPFMWSDEHKAYCFTTSIQEEADDLFNSQGRAMGSYFAPVITIAPKAAVVEEVPLPDEVIIGLIDRGIDLPVDRDLAAIAKALIAAHEKGMEAGRAEASPPVVVPPPEAPVPEPQPSAARSKPRSAKPAPAQQPPPVAALSAAGV